MSCKQCRQPTILNTDFCEFHFINMDRKTHDEYSKKFMTELNEFIDSGGIPITRGLNLEERVQIKSLEKKMAKRF